MKKTINSNKRKIIVFGSLIIVFVLSFLFDKIISNFFLKISQCSLQFIFFINSLFHFINNWIFLGFLGFISIAIYFFYVNKKTGINLGLSYGFSLFVVAILKLLIQRPRPFFPLDFNAFPSAHSAFVFAPVFFLKGRIKKVWIIFAIILSISRIYLGEHYFSDVLFGLLIGLGFSYLFSKSI
jgi:membrane-associated phospholipid phosphatase